MADKLVRTLRKAASITGLSQAQGVDLLIEVYELNDLQTLIRQFRKVWSTRPLKPADLVQLRILKILLEEIIG